MIYQFDCADLHQVAEELAGVEAYARRYGWTRRIYRRATVLRRWLAVGYRVSRGAK